MIRSDIEAILDSDKTRNTKYVIVYKTYNSINGNDTYPIVCKRSEIHLGVHLNCIFLGNKGSGIQIQTSRICCIKKLDDVTFSKTFGK